MSNTPDWPSLWMRERGLIPKYVAEWPIGFGGKAETLADFSRLHAEIPEYARDPMCRDAAVRWLANERRELPRMVKFMTDPAIAKRAIIESALFGPSDESLYAACTAVLDARDRAK